jgi:phage gp29-like protein
MMSFKGLVKTVNGWLGKPIAGPETDPQRWFGQFLALPNPDPILREMGQAEKVYYSIMSDPHVLGDIRSIRGNFRSHDYRILAGDEGNSKSLAAQALCEDWMQRTRPNELADWLEVMWQMSSAFATGYRAHELVWELDGGKYLPSMVADRPQRRIKFNAHGEPMLISRDNMLGQAVEPYQLVVSRHMATIENPYGMAALSCCFWAWTFKTGGWRAFVRYCERHGLPWPVARYPQGTSDAELNTLAKAIETMIESAYALVPEGTGIELLVPNSSGSGMLPQQALIDLCNGEMSKALTGQSMVAELRGVGARAASETALKRQESIDDSVRDISAQSMAAIFRWITLFNFGDGVAPPKLEFFKTGTGGKERAETYQLAARLGANPSKAALLEELGIPTARDANDMLTAPRSSSGAPGLLAGTNDSSTTEASTTPVDTGSPIDLSGIAGFEFARAAGMTEDEAIQLAAQAADQVIEDHMIEPVARMLAQYEADGRTLQEFATDFGDIVGQHMDDEALREVTERALSYSILRGAATRAN